jgi:cytosine/adenosine deaminase-related metal-dependent hydrolase
MTQQLLTGARVYRHHADTDQPAVADVLLDDGMISAIAAPGTLGAPAAVTINLAGHLLIPGFINAHYHSHDLLAKGSFESLPLEQWGLIAGPMGNHRSLAEIRVRTLLGAVEALRNGVTTVQDFSSFLPFSDEVVDTILNAYQEAGLRVIYSITVRDRSQLATILGAERLVPPALRRIIGETADEPLAQLAFIEAQIARIGSRDDMIIWALGPSAPQRCSPTLLKGVAGLAKTLGLPVYTHVYESRGQKLHAAETLQAYGGSAITYMAAMGLLGPHVNLAHGVWPDADEIRRLADSGTGVVLNMLSNLRLRNGVAPIAAYRDAGVRLALGSDNCSCSDTVNLFQVMKLYCLLGGIMNPATPPPAAAEALRLATLGGAHSAGRAGTLGAIEPGHRADLVALDLSDPAFRPLNSVARQLVFAETNRAVRHVWVNGRQVVRDGAAALVDEARLLDELAQLMPAISRDLDRLRADAASISGLTADLQREAWAGPLPYNRYLTPK